MSLTVSNQPSTANVTESQDATNPVITNNENQKESAPQVTSQVSSQPASIGAAPSANYSEAQTGNFFAQTQRSMLFAKLAATDKAQQSNGKTSTNTANNTTSTAASNRSDHASNDAVKATDKASASPAASSSPDRLSGVTVNIADVQKAITPNANGKREPNQGIKTAFEVTTNGTKKALTDRELNNRGYRDQYLKLTDDKGNLTPLGKQFDQLKSSESSQSSQSSQSNGPAVVTELGTDIHQLATLVNGGSKPDPEREATIVAGLISTGLASTAVDTNGKVSFTIVPYRAAANSQIIAAGEQAKTDFENIKKVLPGLKDVQGVVTFAASVYAASFVGVVAAPAGVIGSTIASSLASQATTNILQDGRLPTAKEAATSIVMDLAFAGGGAIVGKIYKNIKNGTKLTELALSPSTQARIAPKELPKYQTIFEGNIPGPEPVKSSVPTTSPTKPITGNELNEQYKKAILLQQSAKKVSEAVPTTIINKPPAIEANNAVKANSIELNSVKTAEVNKIEATATKAVGKAEATAVEQAAKAEAQRLEQLDAGHSIDRHGPEVSLQDLERRLKTGIAPDNKISFAPASTRFNSYNAWVKTREKALEMIKTKYNIDLIQPPSPNDKPYREITIEYDKAIDDGYIPDLSTKQKITATDPVTGKTKNGKAFSSVNFIEGVTGTYTKVAWDSVQNKWAVVQHFPVAENWNNVAKVYNEPLMYKTALP